MSLRFKLPLGTGDVPPVVAARRLAMTLEAFNQALPLLISRGFPPPDNTTGNFDLDAIDKWRKLRHKHLFPDEQGSNPTAARHAKDVVAERLSRITGGSK